MKPELKWRTRNGSDITLGTAGGGTSVTHMDSYNILRQGDGQDEYLGRKIMPKKISIKIRIRIISDGTAGGSAWNRISAHLYELGGFSGVADYISNLDFEGGVHNTIPVLFRTVANTRMRLIRSKFIRMDVDQNHPEKWLTFKYKPKKMMEYTDTAAGYCTNLPVVSLFTDIDSDDVSVKYDFATYMSWYDR